MPSGPCVRSQVQYPVQNAVQNAVQSPVHGPVQSPESRFCTNPIQEVCGTSRLVTALALTYRWGSMGFDRFIDFLPDAKHLSAVDKSAFADILCESAWSLT